MKNVMVRAWEIAKEAAVKFGGKVKEYFAQALSMAWAEAKNIAQTVGFSVYGTQDTAFYFVVNAGVKVSRVYKGSVSNMAPIRTGKNKETGKSIEMYLCDTMEASAFEMVASGESLRFNFNSRRELVWA